jgi:hypothetical protein
VAHLWTLDSENLWVARELEHPATIAAGVALHRLSTPPNTCVLLTIEPRLRLNGLPVPGGLAVLDHRDEIRAPGVTAWFSNETLPRVEPFSEPGARGSCPRCQQPIEPAGPAVRCPQCGVWHHASDELPCWTYAPRCATCPQDTSLDAGFRWTPASL